MAQIALDVDSDLYTLAKVIVGAFDFDFDHAFGFFDDLENPYAAEIRFELFHDMEQRGLPKALEDDRSDMPIFLPEDLPMLQQLGMEGVEPKDIGRLMKAVMSVDIH